MSYPVTPFDISSKALAYPVKCRFVHLLAGIATRHSDTIDCLFQVDGRRVTVAISCAAIATLRQQEGERFPSDQQLTKIAALRLRRALEQGYDPTQAELFVDEPELRQFAQELGYMRNPTRNR